MKQTPTYLATQSHVKAMKSILFEAKLWQHLNDFNREVTTYADIQKQLNNYILCNVKIYIFYYFYIHYEKY
jgi:hypothetical protein